MLRRAVGLRCAGDRSLSLVEAIVSGELRSSPLIAERPNEAAKVSLSS